ncbi:hypothetical protein W97_08324 [Coniosporium apollinis CBS 100218]|uniref:Fungal N-terminal domain-containing protein n=1 Tax=Coniosporium apollinis (strain CBS 100218) TaxID=1168221 RepID=R7Z4X5_CONA1|nr:uncharacterized protein W97_08324 [Coniosporium apollinis CBS 100218]EON69138.1 hypothetical protein W97_08324 [Coniosporium apollinis CBS 100218]
MAFSVSIGDILLLSRLAYRLGQTFTSGRNSAPAEFHEVQNQLYSLHDALNYLADQDETTSGINHDGTASSTVAPPDGVLGRMVANCRGTLDHLEKVVETYTELDPDVVQPKDTDRRRWRFKENWKKIKWTTEGGNLDKLKQSLAIHLNALNLAVAARNR